MPKRYTSYRKKRTTFRRKRRTTKRSSKYARRQQRAASTWVMKKYTKTFVMDVADQAEAISYTLSLIGGRNLQTPTGTITLFDCNQDNQLRTDMGLYQFFRIRGVASKMFFPMPTDLTNSPAQWTNAYSMSDILAPILPTDRVQTMATYQTGPCS